MGALTGNTSGYVYGNFATQQEVMLQSFTLANAGLVTVYANLSIRHSNVDYRIIPRNTAINVYEMYVSDTPRQIGKGDQVVLLVTGGSCDYNFSYTPPYNR